MNTLILDCSCGMNIYLECGEKKYSKVDDTKNRHTDELLLAVDELLKKANIIIKQIDNIVVCVGPGSFTGIRVAISMTKGLAVGINAKIFCLSNFDVFDIDSNDCFLVLEGFSNFVYVREIENKSHKDYCIDLKEFAENVKVKQSKDVYVLSKKTQNQLKNFEISSILAKNDTYNCANQKIKNNEQVEMNKVYPVYLRASQAEIEREKKK